MEDLTPETSAVNTPNDAAPVEEGTSEATSEVPNTDATNDTTAPAEGVEKEGEEFVKDDQGNEFIPRAAFEARLAKLAEQKHNAVGQFLESVKSNPEVRQQVLEALGVESDATESTDTPETPEASAFEDWMGKNVQPEYHAHYKQMAEALFNTMMPHIRAAYQSEMKPLVSSLGQQAVEKFATKHPDYTQYKGEIQKLIRSGRAKNMEDAYMLATYANKMKGVGSAAVSQEKARQAKLAGTPVRRGQSSPAGRPKPTSFREALEQSAKEIGYNQ